MLIVYPIRHALDLIEENPIGHVLGTSNSAAESGKTVSSLEVINERPEDDLVWRLPLDIEQYIMRRM